MACARPYIYWDTAAHSAPPLATVRAETNEESGEPGPFPYPDPYPEQKVMELTWKYTIQ